MSAYYFSPSGTNRVHSHACTSICFSFGIECNSIPHDDDNTHTHNINRFHSSWLLSPSIIHEAIKHHWQFLLLSFYWLITIWFVSCGCCWCFHSIGVINFQEPPLPRRKKCPELAYRSHEFITGERTKNDINARTYNGRARVCNTLFNYICIDLSNFILPLFPVRVNAFGSRHTNLYSYFVWMK